MIQIVILPSNTDEASDALANKVLYTLNRHGLRCQLEHENICSKWKKNKVYVECEMRFNHGKNLYEVTVNVRAHSTLERTLYFSFYGRVDIDKLAEWKESNEQIHTNFHEKLFVKVILFYRDLFAEYPVAEVHVPSCWDRFCRKYKPVVSTVDDDGQFELERQRKIAQFYEELTIAYCN
jgi:hypothetical protein